MEQKADTLQVQQVYSKYKNNKNSQEQGINSRHGLLQTHGDDQQTNKPRSMIPTKTEWGKEVYINPGHQVPPVRLMTETLVSVITLIKPTRQEVQTDPNTPKDKDKDWAEMIANWKQDTANLNPRNQKWQKLFFPFYQKSNLSLLLFSVQLPFSLPVLPFLLPSFLFFQTTVNYIYYKNATLIVLCYLHLLVHSMSPVRQQTPPCECEIRAERPFDLLSEEVASDLIEALKCIKPISFHWRKSIWPIVLFTCTISREEWRSGWRLTCCWHDSTDILHCRWIWDEQQKTLFKMKNNCTCLRLYKDLLSTSDHQRDHLVYVSM